MVKLIGIILIASSILSLLVSAMIDWKYETSNPATGNVIVNILTQPKIEFNYIYYLEAIAFSYSIVSLITGFVFLFRV